jgi:hypothetical protein
VEDRRVEDRREADRREDDRIRAAARDNPWNKPALWLGVLGVLLTIVMAIMGFIASQLASISTIVQSTRDAVIVVTTRQERDNVALDQRVQKLETAVETQQKAYNFNFTSRLATAEAQLGLQPQPKD